jgi:hypothetical protein
MELEVDWSNELHLGEPPVWWREGKALCLCGTSWLVHTLKMSPLKYRPLKEYPVDLAVEHPYFFTLPWPFSTKFPASSLVFANLIRPIISII